MTATVTSAVTQSFAADSAAAGVARVCELGAAQVERLLARYGIESVQLQAQESIPGSYWGESEAGLIGNRVYWRPDTPIHSVLHEACHFICMSETRRAQLDRDAGGDHDEENGVCYLQILLANELEGMSSQRMFGDMDAWGYTFRLGSAQAWFLNDADDARRWLIKREVIDERGRVTWRKRE